MDTPTRNKSKVIFTLAIVLTILLVPLRSFADDKVFTNAGDINAYVQKVMMQRQLDDAYKEVYIGSETYLDYGPIPIKTKLSRDQIDTLEDHLRQNISTSFPSATNINYYISYSTYDVYKGIYNFHLTVLAEADAQGKLRKENAFIKTWVNENLAGLNDQEKIRAIHDYIVNKTDYYDSPDEKSGDYTIYDASSILFGQGGVCQSYTVLFAKMATQAGLDAISIYTKDTSLDPRGHTWNMVKDNGYWKHIDLTFDDIGGGQVSYDTYLVSTDKVRSNGIYFDTSQVPSDEPAKPKAQTEIPHNKYANKDLIINRIAGADRVETSINLSKAYRQEADIVILAKGDTYPDALAASSLAGLLEAPIILNMDGHLEEKTKAEINRLGAKKVILIGGENTLGPAIEDDLVTMGLDVERIAGESRYETSILICQAYLDRGGQMDGLIIASGLSFPDALAASPLAATRGLPIILSPTDGLNPKVKDFIYENKRENVYILGGMNTLWPAVENELDVLGIEGQRISGANRYQTALEIANTFMPGAEEAFLASGESFPDSLVIGGTGISRPILLSPKSKAPEELLAYTFNLKALTLVGGQASLSQNLVNQITGK